MNKNFLENFSFETNRLIKISQKHNLNLDFRDAKYLLDLCMAYFLWPKGAYWKDIFETVLKMSNEDISNPKNLNKVKQWTNRYFNQAIKDGLILKSQSEKDKRVAVFEWTHKGHDLMKDIFEK